MLKHDQTAVHGPRISINNVNPSDTTPYGVDVASVVPLVFFTLVSMGQKRRRTSLAVTPHFTQQFSGTV